MTYNNYYTQPYNYTPITPLPTLGYSMPSQQMPQKNYMNNANNSGIHWVQGEAAARAYYVEDGGKVLLLDLEKDVFYIKSVDASGMPLPLRVFEYKEISTETPKNISQVGQENTQYITKQEFEERMSQIEELLS